MLVYLTLQAPNTASRSDQNAAPARKRQHTAAANVDLHDLSLLGKHTHAAAVMLLDIHRRVAADVFVSLLMQMSSSNTAMPLKRQ